MESRVIFDIVKMEKVRAMARFNQLRRIARLRQIMEVVVVMGLISWSSARVQTFLKSSAHYSLCFSAYLFNHHVVFLVGNAIIVSLFVLCRLSGGDGGEDLCNDYAKHSEAAAAAAALHNVPEQEEAAGGGSVGEDGGGEENRLQAVEALAIPQYDDVSAAIRKATKQIKKFQRTQSEKLRREFAARPEKELRRSCRIDAAEMERLSSEEFRRRVDAFIDEHWSKKNDTKRRHFEELRSM